MDVLVVRLAIANGSNGTQRGFSRISVLSRAIGVWSALILLSGCFSASLRDPEGGRLRVATDTPSFQSLAGQCFGPLRLWIQSEEKQTRVYVDTNLAIEATALESSGNPDGQTDAKLNFFSDVHCQESIQSLVVTAHTSELEVYVRAQNTGAFQYGFTSEEVDLVSDAVGLTLLPEAVDHLSWEESAESLTLEEDISRTSPMTVWIRDEWRNLVTDANPWVFLEAYSDESCTVPVIGYLTARSNPALANGGVVQFERVKYTESESIYLRASLEGLGVLSECLGPIGVERGD